LDELKLADIRFEGADGREWVLEPPTAQISFGISRAAGGFKDLVTAIDAGDLDSYKVVLMNACPALRGKPDLAEQVIF
jgi:hypothetical protein